MTGALYAKVDNKWVPVPLAVETVNVSEPSPGSSYVYSPAVVGPRGGSPTQARFGHEAADNSNGFIVLSDSALWAIGKSFIVHDTVAVAEAARFQANNTLISPWWLTSQPHGGGALVLNGYGGVTDYTLLSLGGGTFLNASDQNTIYFRIGNNSKMIVAPNQVTAYVPIQSTLFITTPSTLAAKEGVRSLRPEREHIVVRPLDPLSDTVEQPDIMALRPVAFRYRKETLKYDDARHERLGLIADEVQHVIPTAVSHDDEGKLEGIDYVQITVALLDHVQRLTDEVATLRHRVAELEGTA